MLSWSAKRRLFYSSVVLMGLIVVGTAIFFVYKPKASCFDGRQNQNELGIDCGGVCPRVCTDEIKPLRFYWTRIFNVAPGRYDLATLVENPNPNLWAKLVKYTVTVLDSNNLVVALRPGQTTLNPGQKFIIFNDRVAVGQRLPARAIPPTLDQPVVWERLSRPVPEVKIDKPDYQSGSSPHLSAEIYNPNSFDLFDITVIAELVDKDENTIAISSTLVERLDRQAKQSIYFNWPQAFAVEPVNYHFYPRVDLTKLPAL